MPDVDGSCWIPACVLQPDHDGPHRMIEAITHWRPVAGKRCRRLLMNPRRGCGQPSVMEVDRGRNPYGTFKPELRENWWAYCAEHSYSREVDGQRVVFVWETAPDVTEHADAGRGPS